MQNFLKFFFENNLNTNTFVHLLVDCWRLTNPALWFFLNLSVLALIEFQLDNSADMAVETVSGRVAKFISSSVDFVADDFNDARRFPTFSGYDGFVD